MLALASILGTVVQIILLIIVAGIVIVGGTGALLSRSRGGTLVSGFVRSIVVPPWPLGWLWVLWSTRRSRRESAGWTQQEPGLPTVPDAPPRESWPPEKPADGGGGRRF